MLVGVSLGQVRICENFGHCIEYGIQNGNVLRCVAPGKMAAVPLILVVSARATYRSLESAMSSP